MACHFTFKDKDGTEITIIGKPAMQAYLADGGLEHLFPGKVFPWMTANDINDNGVKNEYSRDSGDNKGILEKGVSKTLPRDGEQELTQSGSKRNSRNGAKRDEVADDGRDDRTGSLGESGSDIYTDTSRQKLADETPRDIAKEDFYIQDDELGYGSKGEKIAANMAAIRLVKQLEAENRKPTQDEKVILSNFIGWGALKNVFNESSTNAQEARTLKELKSLLNDNEFHWAGQGALAQHFTSPEVVKGIYNILEHIGFKGGNVLEPTVGVGNFIGLMPLGMKDSSLWSGSEIDPIVGKIASYLYPEATIKAGVGFQDAKFQYNQYDLAIGNPPFGDERITDKSPANKAINRFKIHNYIIAKSAKHLKPGGVMAFVVTNRFLDTKDAEARSYLSENFNMLAAIRLPNDAFKKNAGTEVTTDLIFLQKMITGQDKGNQNWLNTEGELINSDGERIRLNQYFAENPELMLGKPSMQGKMYGNKEQFTLIPHDGKSIAEQLSEIIDNKLGAIKGILESQHDAMLDAQSNKLELNRDDVAIGGYVLEGDKIYIRNDDDENGNSKFELLTPATKWTEKTALGLKRYDRIKKILGLRTKAYDLINAERADKSNIEELRAALNKDYDSFVSEYGYLNSSENSRLMSGDIKIEYGLEKNFKSAISAAKAKKTGFSASSETAEKADILKKRVFFPYRNILSAANSRDGYSISLSEKGKVDLDYISTLTGLSKDEVVKELSSGEKPLVYQDPKTMEYIQEDEYLSGNVKRKLNDATGMRGFEKNVAALKAVQPKDVTHEDIFADLGQNWISKSVYEQFLSELGVNTPYVSINTTTGSVAVTRNSGTVPSAIGTAFTNSDYSIPELFNLIANKKPIVAYDVTRDSKTVNQERTKELQAIAKRMSALFRDWVFSDTLRTDDLTKLYNETQNTTIERKITGEHLRTVGANPSISLRDTQKIAAWRMIQQKSVLLDHFVGAGKTITIITGIMERRRLGLSKKPMIVVPNHLVSQWSKDFMNLYPGANILAASEKDFSKANRRRLFARIATGNYDAIIVGHSSFKFIPVEKEVEQQFIRDEVSHLNNALSLAQDNEDKRSVRAIKNRIAKRTERLIALNNSPSDDVASFQQMGIDYLTVDEAHEFKNLEYSTGMRQVPGMGSPAGSQRAFDLYMKVRLLLDHGDGGVTFATGTPISNSLVEMYSLMRYLNKEGLKDRGIESFDAWAKNYASIDPVIEYMATGKLKERNIMGSFNNVPEMMQLFNEFADSVTMDDLKSIYSEQIARENKEKGTNNRTEFPVPKVKDGNRILVKADPSNEQLEYIDYLIERSLNVEQDMKSRDFDPKIDNTLWVYGDAKKAALDLRILDPSAADNPDSKVNKAVSNIYSLYKKSDKDKGTQLVFIDLSTPSKTAKKDAQDLISEIKNKLKFSANSNEERTLNSIDSYDEKWRYLKAKLDQKLDSEDISGDEAEALEQYISSIEQDSAVFKTADTGFSVYDDVKKKLASKGIPDNEIQFIHDYKTAIQKKDLFDLVNSGKIRVLLGSTPKMGAGTNVQERLVGLHHIDASMHNRPSDIEQREGRIIRQGNKLFMNDPDNFEVEIYAYSTERTFDAVSWQTLAKKAKMLESFRTGARKVEEDQGDAKGYMEFMAETTGNPVFREKVKLEGEISELEAIERRLSAQLSSAQRIIKNADSDRELMQNDIDKVKSVIDSIGDAVSLEIDGEKFKNDYEKELIKQEADYRKERIAYAAKLEEYNILREEYDKSEKGKRGKAPSKPKEPEFPYINSARMKESSEAARFASKLSDKIQSMSPGNVGYFKIGNQRFEIDITKGFGDKSARNVEISDSKGIIDINQYDIDLSDYNYLYKVFTKFSPHEYQNVLSGKINRKLAHQNQLETAKEFVNGNRFEKADELSSKKKRFAEVKSIVDKFEADEADRREELDNKYIKLDTARFPTGKPRPKNRPEYTPVADEKAENVPGYGIMRPFTKGDKADDSILVDGYGWMVPVNKNDNIKLSQSRPKLPGSTIAQVQDMLPAKVKKLFASGKLVVVQSVQDLPASLFNKGAAQQEALSSATAKRITNAQALYFPKGDQIFLVADSLNKKNLLPVLSHELLHRSFQTDQKLKTATDKFDTDLQIRFNLALRGKGTKIELDAAKRVIAAKTPQQHQLEEFKAHIVEQYLLDPQSITGKLKRIIADFIAAIRVTLVRAGLDFGMVRSLSPSDLFAMSGYGANVDGVAQGGSDVMASTSTDTVYDAKFMDNDYTGLADRVKRVMSPNNDYRLPNLSNVVPENKIPNEAKQDQVTIYRGVPSKVKDKIIRPGDWVSLNKAHAMEHGTGETGRNKIVSIVVPASDVVWAGTDMNEFFYAPEALKANPGEKSYDLLNRVGVDVFNQEFNQDNPDIRFSMRDSVDEIVNSDPFQNVVSRFDEFTDSAKNNIYALATQRQLIELGKKGLTVMPQYLKERIAMNKTIETLMQHSDAITKDWEQLVEHSVLPLKDGAKKAANKAMQVKLADTMHFATVYGQDPRSPYTGNADNEEAKANYKYVKALYNQLNDKAKKVFNRAAKNHSDHLEQAIAALKHNIEATNASKIAKDTMIQSLDKNLRESSIYFPLSRFGDYWLYFEKDGKKYFNMFETQADLKRFKKANPDIDIESEGIKLQSSTEKNIVPAAFMNDITKLTDQLTDIGEKDQIQDAIYQLYLKSLPDISARKHFIHRNKTPGFHEDALRGFASKAFHDAKLIGRLEHRDKLESYIRDMEEAIKAAQNKKTRKTMAHDLELLHHLQDDLPVPEDIQEEVYIKHEDYVAREPDPVKQRELIDRDVKSLENVLAMSDNIGDDHIKYARILNELQLSHNAMMNPQTSSLASFLNSVGFVNFLGFSASAALINGLQVPVVSFPYMAAKYDAGKVSSFLGKAYNQFINYKDDEGNFSMVGGLTGDDLKAFNTLHDRGILTRTRSMDLIGLGEEGVNHGSVRRKLMYASAYMFNRAEVMNREVTGMAAFRLAMAEHGNFDAAIDYADEVIAITHGDYSGDNRARFMRGNAGRVMFQFKQYSQFMTFNYGKAVLDAIGVTKKRLKGEALTKKDKQAVRLLFGMIAMQGSAAGLMGLPIGGFMIAAQMLANAIDDDDDPIDFEAELKAFIYDNFTDALNINDAIARGPLTAWTGIDFNSRLNQSDMWLREPERELEGQYGTSYLLESLGGPIVGIAQNLFDAKKLIHDDHIMRGIEKILPKSIKDPITALRYNADGGARNMREDLIEEISIAESIAKAGGFGPAGLSLKYDENFIKQRIQGEYKRRRTHLLDLATRAKRDNDPEEFNKVWVDIEKWNSINPEMRITRPQIIKSWKLRMKSSNKMKDGFLSDKRLKDKTDQYSFSD